MQFHLNGFRPGDPAISQFEPLPAGAGTKMRAEEVDVLIVGAGPTGLTLAAQLAAFPTIRTKIVERKSERLRLGQADGIACRTLEMFEAFGFSERVLKEAYWVNETAFWKPDEHNRDHIVRGGRVDDPGVGLSRLPHVILNQARVHDFYLELMGNSPTRLEPSYARQLVDIGIAPQPVALDLPLDLGKAPPHPVTVRLKRLDPGYTDEVETIKARFVVGCDGARSSVRQGIGRTLEGASANQAWGVMDVLAVTDFPDIRLKCAIHSASDGTILIIPREGGYLTRFYVELDELAANARLSSLQITLEQLVERAQRILRPYTLEVKEVAWWSIYEIGQRICERFDDLGIEDVAARIPRVFIAGDACHVHSPKAGQGMNVSMQDAFNLGWKLASVLTGRCTPRILLTYSAERHAVAQELIDFDRQLAKLFSAQPKDPLTPEAEGVEPAEFQKYFVQQGQFTTGTATCYPPSLLCAEPVHQHLAPGFVSGTRFHSAPVIRLADAKPVHLGQTLQADGRWRLFLFAPSDNPASPRSAVRALCEFLATAERSPVRRYTPREHDVDSVIDVRAIFQQPHRELSLSALPPLLLPRKGRYQLIDYEKVFCPNFAEDIFKVRGIDRQRGCMVVVRPDQHVAAVLPMDAYEELSGFFAGFMVEAH